MTEQINIINQGINGTIVFINFEKDEELIIHNNPTTVKNNPNGESTGKKVNTVIEKADDGTIMITQNF